MSIINNKLETQVWILFRAWAKKYRADYRKENPITPYNNNKFIKEQIEFIHLYLAHMLLDGDSPQNLQRIKRLLSMQEAVADDTKLEFRFIGGYPFEVALIADSLNDIDIADTYGITDFERINIYKGKNRRWTKKSVNEMIQDISYDLRFDGLESKFEIEFHGNHLYIECSIE
ncbi:MAG: hypothetical protein IT392_09465 [Nitrospirae bacterium]|nr:hypothetical protein [Nitrospirota bacterium]